MTESDYENRVARLSKLGEQLAKLPSEIRAGAFDLFKDYVTGGNSPNQSSGQTKSEVDHQDVGSAGEFFAMHDSEKPANNVKLIAAYFYRTYGSEQFTTDEIKQTADAVGITVPSRIDMTLTGSKEKGKKLFQNLGKGRFKPTVHGEGYLKTTYSVKKGTSKRPVADAE